MLGVFCIIKTYFTVDIKLEKKDSTLASLFIQFNPEDYEPLVKDKVKEYSKKANIKGFRPGKVPPQVIRGMMGESIKAEEINKLLEESIQKYIQENDLKLLGNPLPSDDDKNKSIDWKNDQDFEFSFDLGLIPEFDYTLSDKLKFTKYEVKVDDKTLEETSDRVRKENGDELNPEVSEEGDSISGQLEQKEGDFSENIVLPIDDLEKKEAKKFIGKKSGDTITFDLKKAIKDEQKLADILKMPVEDVKSLEGEFILTITNIIRYTKANLDQDFFDKIFGPEQVTSEEEYYKRIREMMEGQYVNDTDYMLFTQIRKKLIADTNIDINPDFLKKWLVETQENISAEDVEKDFDKYEEEIKWSILRNKIVQDYDIKAEHDQIRALAFEQIKKQFMGGQEIAPEMEEQFNMFVDKYLQENNGKQYMNFHEQAMAENIYKLLKEKVTIKNKEVTPDELKKVVDKEMA